MFRKKITVSLLAISLLITLLTGINVSADESAARSASDTFPIGIFWPPSPQETSFSKYEEIKDMNANFIVAGNGLVDPGGIDPALVQADANDLSMLVSDWNFSWRSDFVKQPDTDSSMPLQDADTIGQTFTSPAGTGYYLGYIALNIEPMASPVSGVLTLKLYDNPAKTTLLGSAQLPVPTVSNRAAFSFGIPAAGNQSYYMELSGSPLGTYGNVAIQSSDVYAGGQLYAGGSALSKDLSFEVHFEQFAYNDGRRPSDATLDAITAHYSTKPAVLGYSLYDEPNAEKMSRLEEMTRRLRANDPDRMSFVNLLPNYASTSQLFGTTPNDGNYVTATKTMGQTFKTGENESYISTIQLWIDPVQWTANEQLTLTLWDSPAKTTAVATTTMSGTGYSWPQFALNTAVTPDTLYYMELTHAGGGDGSVGWVVHSGIGQKAFYDGTAYIDGASIDADLWYTINQNLQSGTYEDYVYRWVRANPDVLVYDHYPFRINDGFSSGYYDNMEVIRRQSLAGDVDFWTYIQSVGIDNYLRPPSKGDLNYHIYTSLAYGAKGYIYFTYTTPQNQGAEQFSDGLILPDGSKNISYEWARDINAEVLNLGPTLLKLTSQAVYHAETDVLPSGTTALPSSFFWQPSSADEQMPMIISSFLDEDGREYVMVVNKDLVQTHTQTFTLSNGAQSVTEVSKATGLEIATGYNAGTGSFSAAFAPGEGRLYALDFNPASNRPEAALTGSASSQAGKKFNLTYELNNLTEPVLAQDIKLNYDPSAVEFVSAKPIAEGVKLVRIVKEPGGKLRLVLASEGTAHPVTLQAEVMELTFKAKKSLQSAADYVSISSAALGDAQGNEIQAMPSTLDAREMTNRHRKLDADINQDGTVSVGDLSLAAAYYGKNKKSPDWEQVKRADMRANGKIDWKDLEEIAKKLVE
ncbi:cohesin domain-containing protein [Paenibacillus mendelii]|uniref:Cohesin domain-containing protein n=1 Tax=Paenibacillus mendelii TaxID=206163 RepID=A0ABV6JFV6_9BACL|nr:cohesin domain-containing protein [Paenibacillus mendelii]MCQ6557678.1 cohesin domain-containing protein [Paenibacillus mendelii]